MSASPEISRDRELLARAVALSLEGATSRLGGPFGAVVVREGRIIAEGCNEVTSSNDPTAHAEIVAIRRACSSLGAYSLAGSTIYASCEPCPMCLAAIYWARLDRLVFANTRDQAAAIGFDDALIYEEIPRPAADRRLPVLHLPGGEAESAFAAWMSIEDRQRY